MNGIVTQKSDRATLIGSFGFVWFIVLFWKYILEMCLRREIIWHSFLYSIYVSHVEILVRVGKLVWLRMGKVREFIFGMIVWIRQ